MTLIHFLMYYRYHNIHIFLQGVTTVRWVRCVCTWISRLETTSCVPPLPPYRVPVSQVNIVLYNRILPSQDYVVLIGLINPQSNRINSEPDYYNSLYAPPFLTL